jgi:hypothetical protein
MSAKHVKELKWARRRIESQECHYICDALRLGGRDLNIKPGMPFSDESQEIVDMIHADMAAPMGKYCYSLETWLDVKGCRTPTETYESDKADKKLRATRLAWIDALIEYWINK